MRKTLFNKYFLIISLLVLGIVSFILLGKVKKPVNIAKYDKVLPEVIDYNLHVKPILSDKCFLCHGPDKNNGQKGGLDLSTKEGALAALKSGKHAIVPGSLAKSEFYYRITTTDEEMAMPSKASNRALSDYQKAILIKWIEQGAEYKKHWAFIPPEQNKLPEVKDKKWPKNSIDFFVLKKLEENGVRPSPIADKETLLRRVTLDLTGLPPSLDEVDAFLTDNSPDAYEKVVKKLLLSPQYGEKMAVDWLDVSRYADTHGYTVDRYRAMWPWRDWVIKSFNDNMPFNQFITWQMAGDLLPNATREQRLATAFNRIHPQNMEGGIINEEFRSEYVADRTSTLGTAFMGLTIGCARCHDHKFDPISQKDFFSLYSFFNNINEAGQISWDNAMPVPTLWLTDGHQDSALADLTLKEKQKEKELATIRQQEKQGFDIWKQKNGGEISMDLKKDLQAYFTFDKLVNGAFVNEMDPKGKGTVADPVLSPGKFGNAFKSNGDDVLQLGKVGIFNRFQPFSIALWVNIPANFRDGVLIHKGSMDITYNFRGYYLRIKDGKAELLMAHTWPDNNIQKVSVDELPREKWIQLTFTYNGSGKANGLKLFLNGKEAAMTTEIDNLTKDILFAGSNQPGVQVGAETRGTGFKNGLVDEVFIYARELNPAEAMLLTKWQPGNYVQKTALSNEAVNQYYFSNISANWQEKHKELLQLRQERNVLSEPINEIMVMEEMKKKRTTHILLRGAYDAPGAEVQADVPASILPYPAGLRRDRLGLAQWLTDPKNPLTSRVVVNRYWQTYFGTGILKSADNFGNQGSMPSNPELLDWLAVAFQQSGWNVRAMQELIVLSSTYRQSSHVSAEQLAKDPDNIMLSRGPAFRLTAEMIRDGALKASGLITTTIGGPSVKPYQPEGLWAVNSDTYVTDTGANLYRRSLYTFWRRSNPPPSMSTFDAPLRSSCIVQRQKTSTPLQALVLLNDPQFIEAAKVLAVQAFEKYDSLPARITYCYRSLTGLKPSVKEVKILEKLYAAQYQQFKKTPEKMKGWLNAGEYKVPEKLEPHAIAATAVMASTILNSDAFITRR